MNSLFFALIEKDFKQQRQVVSSYIVSAIFYSVIFIMMDNLGSLPFLLTFQVLFTSTLVSFAFEEKNNSYRFLLSMPISRSQIVTGRYLFILLMTLITIPYTLSIQYLLVTLVTNMHMNVSIPEISIQNSLYSISAVTIVIALYLPLIFKMGSTKSTPYIRILMMVIIAGTFAVQWLLNLFKSMIGEKLFNSILTGFSSLNSWIPTLLVVITSLVILLISSNISKKIFSRRDLFVE